MKQFIKIAAILVIAAAALVSCEDDFNYKFADHGPTVTVNSCSTSAYMGGSVSFNVSISDPDFSLSTILAELYFDEDLVSSVTIRTATEGQYEGTLSVPFLAGIPDGTATLVFTGTNTGQGQTVLAPVNVSVSRPVFEYLTLTLDDGTEYQMTPTDEKHVYAVTDSFDANVNATIATPAVESGSDGISFGWSNSAIEAGSDTSIPFSNGIAGTYTISFNTLTFEGSPFVSLTVNDVETTMVDADNYEVVLDLTQGETVTIDGYAAGFEGWTIDSDWFEEISDGSYKFLAVDGKYKITIELDNEFFRVEAMASTSETASLNSDLSGAIWLIGSSTVGKPSYDAVPVNWNTDNGLCLSQIEEKKYQITLVGGVSLSTSSVNIKFYSAKGWSGEFGSDNLSCDSDLVYVNSGDSDNGNVFNYDGVTLEMGGIYKFTVDLTNAVASSSGAPTGAVLTVEKVGTQEIETEDITVNGTTMEMVTSSSYKGNVTFTQNEKISITGIDDLSSWYLSPDYLYTEASGNVYFNAVSGTYEVTLYTGGGYAEFVRLDGDGNYAEFADGGLYILGWGVAYPHMGNQAGWTTETAPALAQVSDGVFQLTGLAVNETDTTMGGAFRTDYIDMKYYGQRAWGAEAGLINGNTNAVQLTDEAAKWLTLTSSNNLDLASGVTLDEGSTYRLTIDLSDLSDGIEKIDFAKVSD